MGMTIFAHIRSLTPFTIFSGNPVHHPIGALQCVLLGTPTALPHGRNPDGEEIAGGNFLIFAGIFLKFSKNILNAYGFISNISIPAISGLARRIDV
jgi:hypothetical protein